MMATRAAEQFAAGTGSGLQVGSFFSLPAGGHIRTSMRQKRTLRMPNSIGED